MHRGWAVVASMLLGCGAATPTGSGPEVCSVGESGVFGRLYVDRDGSDRSSLVRDLGWRDDPVPGSPVTLVGPNLLVTTTTCSDGSFAFGGLRPGAYVVAMEGRDRAASKNYGPYASAAVRRGTIRIVTIGDSFPRVGSSDLFPEVTAEHFEAAGLTVENRNIASNGSTAEEWLPGSYRFDGLAERLPNTDVLVISLGGNDVLEGIFDPFTDLDDDEDGIRRYVYTATEALSDAPLQIEEALAHVRVIADQARELNPRMDIVWVLYPNLLRGKPWRDAIGPGANLFVPRVDAILDDARRNAARDDVLLLDVHALLRDRDIDGYLHDTLHLNDEGHRLAGEELFRTLGGVLLTESERRAEYSVGLVAR